jgi:hypothetical protein
MWSSGGRARRVLKQLRSLRKRRISPARKRSWRPESRLEADEAQQKEGLCRLDGAARGSPSRIRLLISGIVLLEA